MVQIAGEQTGIVKWYEQAKLYGFIVPDNKDLIMDEQKPDIFFHVRQLADGVNGVDCGQRVVFDVVINPGRGLMAVNVRLCEVTFMERR